MKKPILDDHLIDFQKEKLKRPSILQYLKFKGVVRFIVCQAIVLLMTLLLVSVGKSEMETGGSFLGTLMLIIAYFVGICIVGYNIYMGWIEMMKKDLFDYGALGVLMILWIIGGMVILSILILYGWVIDFQRLFPPIFIISMTALARYFYDWTKSH